MSSSWDREGSHDQALMDQSPVGLFWAATDGVLLDVNRTLVEILGSGSRSALIGKPLQSLFVDPDVCAGVLARLAGDTNADNLAARLVTSRGEIEALVDFHHGAAGGGSVAGAVREITAWKAAREESERFRTIVMSMSQGAVLLNAAGDILACNPSAEKILGLSAEEMAGHSTHDTRWATIYEDGSPFPSDQHPVAVSLRTGESREGILQGVHRPDGSLVWIRINSTPLFHRGEENAYAVIATFEDVTERRALEAQFLQAQKLEALGQLAGGVAHDFNNMLTVIFNRCELLLRRLASDDRNRNFASEILAAARQSATLTQQLLAAARRQVLQPKVVDLATEMRDGMQLLRRSIGEDITVRAFLDDPPWRIFADPGKLRQVLMNLVLNARDAMPDGGTLTIEVRNFLADAAYVRIHSRIPHGEYVTLTVSDTGCGIEAANQSRIYDPFFSTKAPGKGSGLGLAVVRGIVEQTGGHITVYSEEGRGTTFKLFFPRAAGEIEQLLTAAAESAPQGTETILVVEDEDLVRSVIRDTLEEHGYTVLEAPGPIQALEIASSLAPAPHLLITDLTMPVMRGTELAKRLRALHPSLRVIVMSGYSDRAIAHQPTPAPRYAFLEKPVTAGELLRKVRSVLDDRSTGPR